MWTRTYVIKSSGVLKLIFRALLSSLWKEKGPIGQGEDRQKVLHPQKREAPHLGQVGTAIQRQEKLRLEC